MHKFHLGQVSLFLFLILCWGCNSEDVLFVKKENTGIEFSNTLTYSEAFNPYTYRNFYNGAGVAIGDINNDGLDDIYLTGNQVDNQLYLNEGNWSFRDITSTAGVACRNVWSSGANMVDVNGDGLLDIYVCKAGLPAVDGVRHNELFINNGDLTFSERSREYGLDITGLGIQSAFFDYDRDGDLDCYILSNSIRSVAGFNLEEGAREVPSTEGNKLLQNQNGRYVDVSIEAGIYTSNIGYGLGITISDFNLDTWPDLYISNDFFEKDYLYINQQDGTFEEESDHYLSCQSLGSMGADAGDLDNDAKPDLLVTEMLPSTEPTRKTNAIYESWKKHQLAIKKGYHHQMPRNVLQRNMGDSTFLEIGRLAGIEATDWSWSSLLADYDNDGLKDIFISNGIYKDLLDRDYLTFTANDTRVRNLINTSENAITQLIDTMPVRPTSNRMFHNLGRFRFEDVSDAWGLGEENFSNGCAYSDLDNDGDLDLIVNNVNMPVGIYENTSDRGDNHYVSFSLSDKKTGNNVGAIGAMIKVYNCNGDVMVQEKFPSRGFQSSVSHILTFGVGDCASIDSAVVIWPDGRSEILTNLSVDQRYDLDKGETDVLVASARQNQAVRRSNGHSFIDFKHIENQFNQFDRERVMYKMNTEEGPSISVADVNGDGLQDIFIGGAKNQNSVIYLSDGDTYHKREDYFLDERKSEVVESVFFDSDGDGDLDLYVAHGGSAFSLYSRELDDVLYVNDGQGNLTCKSDFVRFPSQISSGGVAIFDLNGDSKPDIFLGDRNSHLAYGIPGDAYVLVNQGENRYEFTAPENLQKLGMITTAQSIDANADGNDDIIVSGEFMGIHLFINTGEGLVDMSRDWGLSDTKGMINTLQVLDINGDGREDFIVGNAGQNSYLTSDHKLCINDFDKNGSLDPILCRSEGGRDVPVLDMDELMSQVPAVKKKFVYYADYASMDMEDIFSKDLVASATRLELDDLTSRVYLNEGEGFKSIELPTEIQYSSIFAISASQDLGGKPVLLFGGNHYNIKPQFGREDASKGWLVMYRIDGKELVFSDVYPLGVSGEIRDIEWLDNRTALMGINDEMTVVVNLE